MHLNRIAISVVALLVGTVFIPTACVHAAQGPPPPGWDVPPQELNEIQRQGFHEGIEAAHRDFDMQRRPGVEDHEIYRHPHLPPEQREVFRDGFRRGYDRAMRHLAEGERHGFQPPQPPPPPPQWDAFPTEFNDMQRRGFHDGMEGARRDYENHRPPDVNNRDEYRHPRLPPELREAYREGFRRGYDRAMAHLLGQPFRY